ncbi:hypothetical protein ACR2WM_26975, partial [Klebsiella pneumoniae]
YTTNMGGKDMRSVIICVVILSLFVEQIQVEAKSCCKNTIARNCYNVCRLTGPRKTCASICGCKIISGKKCPSDYPKFNLLPNPDEANAIEYCKLGCTSFVCDNINTVVESEELNDVMERCNNACYDLCTKDADITIVGA